jgi:hypothetical protein
MVGRFSTLLLAAAELEACAGADPKARHLPFRCARMLESVVHAFASHIACMKRPGHPQVSQRAGMLLQRCRREQRSWMQAPVLIRRLDIYHFGVRACETSWRICFRTTWRA